MVGVKYMHGAPADRDVSARVPVVSGAGAGRKARSTPAIWMRRFYSTMLKDFMAMVVQGDQTLTCSRH